MAATREEEEKRLVERLKLVNLGAPLGEFMSSFPIIWEESFQVGPYILNKLPRTWNLVRSSPLIPDQTITSFVKHGLTDDSLPYTSQQLHFLNPHVKKEFMYAQTVSPYNEGSRPFSREIDAESGVYGPPPPVNLLDDDVPYEPGHAASPNADFYSRLPQEEEDIPPEEEFPEVEAFFGREKDVPQFAELFPTGAPPFGLFQAPPFGDDLIPPLDNQRSTFSQVGENMPDGLDELYVGKQEDIPLEECPSFDNSVKEDSNALISSITNLSKVLLSHYSSRSSQRKDIGNLQNAILNLSTCLLAQVQNAAPDTTEEKNKATEVDSDGAEQVQVFHHNQCMDREPDLRPFNPFLREKSEVDNNEELMARFKILLGLSGKPPSSDVEDAIEKDQKGKKGEKGEKGEDVENASFLNSSQVEQRLALLKTRRHWNEENEGASTVENSEIHVEDNYVETFPWQTGAASPRVSGDSEESGLGWEHV